MIRRTIHLAGGLALAGLFMHSSAWADPGGRLLATGGVTQFEGAAGGGLTPWALIAGYGTEDEIGGTAFYTTLDLDEYSLDTVGVAVGIHDRVELSYARQSLDVGSGIVSNTFNALSAGAVTVGPGTDIAQDVFGAKVRLFGDAVYEQDTWLPQVAVGVQYKKNQDFDSGLDASAIGAGEVGVPAVLGAEKDDGLDIYVAATKLLVGVPFGKNLLLNGTARATRANTFGLLGFETARDDDYEIEFAGSAALFLNNSTVVGYEFRTQSNRLADLGGASVLAETDTARDVFLAYLPNKHVAFTVAYVDLGNLPFQEESRGFYLSAEASF